MNKKIIALQSILSSDNVYPEAADTFFDMIRKEQEKELKKVHNWAICGPFGARKYYTTRAPWVPSGKIKRDKRDDLIDYLYEHYFSGSFDNYTVQQMFEHMTDYYQKHNIVSSMTLTHYKSDWNTYMVGQGCEWLNAPISHVKPGQIFEFYRLLTANSTMKRSTFNNLKTVINAVFDYAINKDVPCTKASLVSTKCLKFAPEKDKWEGVYTDIDKQKILKVCEEMKPTVYTKAIELMFCMDIRIGELRALYKEDVNLDCETVYIGHQMVERPTDKVNRHSVRTNIMKGGKEAGKRTHPLSKRAIRVIKWLFETYPDTEWLLPSKAGNTPIRAHRFNDNLKKICELAGVKYFSSHGIRFHNISAMYDANIEEKEIQRLSGHTTPMMTRHYNKIISSYDDSTKIREILG